MIDKPGVGPKLQEQLKDPKVPFLDCRVQRIGAFEA